MLEIPKTAEKLRQLALESGQGVPAARTATEGVVTPRKDRQDLSMAPARAKKKKRTPSLSFLLMVVTPIVLSVLYYVFIASDQYAAVAKFTIRGADTQASGDLLG